jgi:hypothetical protein
MQGVMGEDVLTQWVECFLDRSRYACCGAEDLEFEAVVGDEGDVFGGFVVCHCGVWYTDWNLLAAI